MSTLQTFSGSKINEISKKLQLYLDKRPLKGTVKYRMLNGTINNDPQAKEKDKIQYPTTQLHIKSKIKDPETGRYVEISHIKSFDESKNVAVSHTKLIMAVNGEHLTLTEGIVEDEEMYPVIELMNENLSNPYRDVHVTALFERIDLVKESTEIVSKNNMLFKAWQAIDIMDMPEKRLYHAANGGSYDDAPMTIDANLQSLAKSDPEKFYKMVDSPLTGIKSLIKQCNDKNYIQYDAQQHKYSWVGGDAIATLNRIEGQIPIDQFTEWLNTAKTGVQIQLQMKNLLVTEEPKGKK